MISLPVLNRFSWLKNLVVAALVVLVAAGAAVGLAAVWLNPPAKELADLFSYLLLSGGISVVLGLVWLAYGSHNVRLYVQLSATYLIGVVIALVNITVTAGLMFLSAHDFSLLALLLVFSAILSVFFALYISRQLTQQVAQLVSGVQELAEGKLQTRIKGGGPREMLELSEAFNRMAEQLQASFKKQQDMEAARQELVASIGHDLRTPLASMQLMVEAIHDGVTDEGQTQIFLERIRNEVLYMSDLIEDLFALSQLDAGVLKLKPEPGQLSDLLSDTLESMRALAQARQHELVGEVEGELPEISYDAPKIQRVLNNLVSNAIHHTAPGGQIVLGARVNEPERAIEISVRDNGEGIAPADLEHIFDSFYRGERSRGREHGGAGLGLAIAKGLVEAHGGTILVESVAGQGASFIFRLPLQKV